MTDKLQGWGGRTSTSFPPPWHPHLGESQHPKVPAPVRAVSCPCCQLPASPGARALWEAPLIVCSCGKGRNCVCTQALFLLSQPRLAPPLSHCYPLPSCQDKAGALPAPPDMSSPFCSLLPGPRRPSGGHSSSPVSTSLLTPPPALALLHPIFLQTLLIFPAAALTMAGEQAEPALSRPPETHWEPQLQAIDPSVQVCPGLLTLWWGFGMEGRWDGY